MGRNQGHVKADPPAISKPETVLEADEEESGGDDAHEAIEEPH